MANTKVTGDLIASGTITAANLVSGTLDSILGTYLSTNSYATESYVTTAVSNLIDAAPASLDTLNELAAALNDDANFATTVTDSIATKLPLAGGNITGNLSVDTNVLFVDAANDRVGIGTSSPAVKLDIVGASPILRVLATDTGGDAALNLTALGTDGSSLAVSRMVGLNEGAGATSALSFETRGSNGVIEERVRINSAGNVGIGVSPTTSQTRALHIGATTGGTEIHITSALGSTASNGLSIIQSGSESYIYNRENGTLRFATDNTERMRIGSNGNVSIGGTATGDALRIYNSGYPLVKFIDGSTNRGLLGYVFDWGVFSLQSESNLTFRTGASGGSERMRIEAGGNVGIGTALPSEKLHVVSSRADVLAESTSVSQATRFRLKTTSREWRIGTNATQGDSLWFYDADAASYRMLIDSSGNVGIGTTSPVAGGGAAGTTVLHVNGATEGQIHLTNSTTGATTNDGFNLGASLNDVFYNNREAGNQIFYNNGAERMRITSTGNVGIGTSNPLYKLTLPNNNFISFNNDSSNPFGIGGGDNAMTRIVMGAASGAGSTIQFGVGSNGTYAGFSSKMIINSAGNTTIMPAGLANGTLTVGRNGNFASLGPVSDGNGTTTAFLSGYSSASGTSNAIIYTNGTYGSRTGTYGAIISDQRYKENIIDTSPKLDKIMQVRVRNFNLIGDELKQIGVIAQEIEQIFPSLVYERELTKNIETIDNEGNVVSEVKITGETAKAVKDSIFTYILLKGIQELKGIVDQQQIEIDNLKAQLNG